MKEQLRQTNDEQYEHLCHILKSFGRFRGAKREFVLKYNDKTGKNYAKNLVNKILARHINFSRKDDLSTAISIAEKVYTEHMYEKSNLGWSQLLSRDNVITNKSHIAEMVDLADNMFCLGQNQSAYELLTKLTARIDLKKLFKKS